LKEGGSTGETCKSIGERESSPWYIWWGRRVLGVEDRMVLVKHKKEGGDGRASVE